MKARAFLILLTATTILLWRCGGNTETQVPTDSATTESGIINQKISGFSADNAYQNIEKQLAFGFRIPGTAAHKNVRIGFSRNYKTPAIPPISKLAKEKHPKTERKYPFTTSSEA